MIRSIVFALLLIQTLTGFSQFSDDFSDGDFTNAPTWTGQTTRFIVNGSNELQLNAPAVADESYLVTGSSEIDDSSWKFVVRMGFPTSGTSFTKVYLMSDQADLTGSLNGYFVLIGETEDEVSLWRQDGNTEVMVIDGVDKSIEASSVNVRVEVTRDALGNWELFRDVTGGNTFFSEGTAPDNTYQSASFFGVRCTYTLSRSDSFFFDDFLAGQDNSPPEIVSVSVISSTEIDIQFSEDVEQTSAEDITNYSLNLGSSVTNASRDGSDLSLVHLTTSTLTNGQTYTLSVSNVADVNANPIVGSIDVDFSFLVLATATTRDVQINEFMADPTPSLGLPEADFVELYNPTSNYYDLANWQIGDAVSQSGTMASFILAPDSYVIICSTSDIIEFASFGDVIGVSSFPNFNSSSDDAVVLLDDVGAEIDRVDYEGSDVPDDGTTLEQISPNRTCSGIFNFSSSTDGVGGTPGAENSVFFLDILGPNLLSANVITADSIRLDFDEVIDSATVQVGDISFQTSLVVDQLYVLDNLPQSIFVKLGETIEENIIFQITVIGITDCAGNELDQATASFQLIIPAEANLRDVQINEFLADPSPSLGLPEIDFVELYNPTSNHYDLANWQIGDAVSQSGTMASFILAPDSYVIICSTSDVNEFESFGDVIGVSSFPNFNSSSDDAVVLLDDVGAEIDRVDYEGSDVLGNGITLEQISPNRTCSGIFNFGSSQDSNGGTPGAENSVFLLDILGPNLLSANAITADSIRLDFDEVIDSATVQVGDISFQTSLVVDQLYVLDNLPQSIFVKLGETIEENIIFQITVIGITDCAGNEVDQATVSFELIIPAEANFRDVQINEFMADPTPSLGLPEVDFIELYNPTNNFFNLENWKIGDSSSKSGSMENFLLAPNSYLIVCGESDIEEFEPFGDVIGVSSFPNFNSSTNDVVVLLNSEDVEMDRVSYSGSDITDGTTLEQINPDLVCSGAFNFEPSLNESGGTPGAENSVLMIVPDNFGPNLILVRALSSDSLRLDFDEVINGATVGLSDIVFQPSIATDTLYLLTDYPQSIFVKLAESVQANVSIQVTVTGISDCAGNSIDEGTLSFFLGLEPEEDDILLSEILFNPRPDGSDFVEIYNPSTTENFELRGWKLARLKNDIIDDEEEIASEGLLMAPGQFLVFTDDINDISLQYPSGNPDVYIELSGFPSFSNDEDTVVLVNSQGIVVQQFDYQEDFHYELLEDVDGVSLERVSYEHEVNDPNNWRSAASTVGFATPGRVNSQSAELATGGGELQIVPKVFLPGNGGSGRDFTTINYSFNQGGKFANIIIYDQNGRQVKEIANGVSLSASGFFRWDGTSDSGSIARMGYHVVIFEVFDGKGNKSVLKETVVVGRDF